MDHVVLLCSDRFSLHSDNEPGAKLPLSFWSRGQHVGIPLRWMLSPAPCLSAWKHDLIVYYSLVPETTPQSCFRSHLLTVCKCRTGHPVSCPESWPMTLLHPSEFHVVEMEAQASLLTRSQSSLPY